MMEGRSAGFRLLQAQWRGVSPEAILGKGAASAGGELLRSSRVETGLLAR
jgi:hypothetical protein